MIERIDRVTGAELAIAVDTLAHSVTQPCKDER